MSKCSSCFYDIFLSITIIVNNKELNVFVHLILCKNVMLFSDCHPWKPPRVCCRNVCGLPKSRNVWCKVFSSLERVKGYYYYYYEKLWTWFGSCWKLSTNSCSCFLTVPLFFDRGSASGDKKKNAVQEILKRKRTKKCKNHLINVAEQHDPAWCVLTLVTWLLICVSPVHVPVTQ